MRSRLAIESIIDRAGKVAVAGGSNEVGKGIRRECQKNFLFVSFSWLLNFFNEDDDAHALVIACGEGLVEMELTGVIDGALMVAISQRFAVRFYCNFYRSSSNFDRTSTKFLLTHSSFTAADLQGRDLSWADFSGSSFRGLNFKRFSPVLVGQTRNVFKVTNVSGDDDVAML
jgi:uncharacterized protein YjbI with pentapeptide repeats